MSLAKESTLILNKSNYSFILKCDPLKGIIHLTKNTSKALTIRITTRCIPITEDIKWKFYYSRSGYADKNSKFTFVGSYISKFKNENSYKIWEKYMRDEYKKLSQIKITKEN